MDLEARVTISNDLLSETEQLTIRQLLNQAEEYVESLNQDISRSHTHSHDFQERRAEGLSRIERLRAGVAPHKKVPTEILANVFTYCLDRPLLYLPPIRDQTIWKVMAVCSRWRQIALAEPRIWHNLRADDKKNAKYLKELLHDVFSNRGGQGMIRYWAPLISSTKTWDNLVDLISTYPSRFRHLWLEFRNFFPPPPTHTPVKLEHLQSIYFSFSWENKYDSVAIPATDFFTSPGLQEVALVTRRFSPPSAWSGRISLPWSQLIDITVEGVSVSLISPVLRQCKRLVKLLINLKGESGNHDPSCQFILLPHLQSLSFALYSDDKSVKSLLDLLIVPELQSLSLGDHHWVNWPQTNVLHMVDRSKCALTTLITSELALADEEVLQLMRAMPQLTEFFGYTKDYVSDLTLNTIRTENLAPRLRTLDGLWVQSLRPLIELVQSRCWASTAGEGSGIRNIVVGIPYHHPSTEEEYYKDALGRLRECGVDIEIYTV